MKPMFLRSSTRSLSVAREVVAEDLEAALLNPAQGADQGQQGRFARTRGSRHDHDLAPADLQVVVEEDLGPRLAAPVRVVHVFGADHHIRTGRLHHRDGGQGGKGSGVGHGGVQGAPLSGEKLGRINRQELARCVGP